MRWSRIVIVACVVAPAAAAAFGWPVWRHAQHKQRDAELSALRDAAIARHSYLQPCDSSDYRLLDHFRAALGGEPELRMSVRSASGQVWGVAVGHVEGKPMIVAASDTLKYHPRPIPFSGVRMSRDRPQVRRAPIPRALFDALQVEWQRSTADTWWSDRSLEGEVVYTFVAGGRCGIESEAVPGTRTQLLIAVGEALYRFEDEAQVRAALHAVPELPVFER